MSSPSKGLPSSPPQAFTIGEEDSFSDQDEESLPEILSDVDSNSLPETSSDIDSESLLEILSDQDDESTIEVALPYNDNDDDFQLEIADSSTKRPMFRGVFIRR